MDPACHIIKLLCTFSRPFVYVWTWMLSCIKKPMQAISVSKLGFISYDCDITLYLNRNFIYNKFKNFEMSNDLLNMYICSAILFVFVISEGSIWSDPNFLVHKFYQQLNCCWCYILYQLLSQYKFPSYLGSQIVF